MCATMVGHGEKHDAVAMDISQIDISLFVGFPNAMNDQEVVQDRSEFDDRAPGSNR